MAYPTILGNSTPFLDKVFSSLTEDGISVEAFELDHICYRVETAERYEEVKAALLAAGVLLTEKPIGGRPIATIKLHEPIVYHDRVIACVELPMPKDGSPYVEGYEHVEFVIDEPLRRFTKRYPTLKFDLKGVNKRINADVRLRYEDFSVKFHEYPLEYVITRLEA